MKTGNATEAARQVYDVNGDDSARAIGAQKLAILSVAEIMDDKGLTDDKLVEVLNKGLESTKPIGALVLIKNGKDGKPEQILKDNEGQIEVADYAIRHKYLETALKLRGHLSSDKGTNVLVNVNNTIEPPPKDTELFIQWRDEQRRKQLTNAHEEESGV